MSPLTKLFVVLLVILSLLTTAATVVFVNQVEDFKAAQLATKSQLTAAQQDLADAQQQTASFRDLAQSAERDKQQQAEQMRQSVNQIQQHGNELAAQNAQLSAQLALQSADLTRVTEALKSSQESGGKKDEMITQLRSTGDERLKQNVELNTAVTTLTNDLQVTERERKYLAEQLTEVKSTVDKQGAMLRDAGVNPKMAGAGISAGAPPINGVIRARREIAGIPYATISVGSNDGVAKGMEFKVINRQTGDYLGILTVDSVEQTESTGRLSGPRVRDIAPGVEVRTQL